MLKGAAGNFQVDGSSRLVFPVIVCIRWEDLDDDEEEEGEKGVVVVVVLLLS
jgi:hypothetical protein